MNTPTWIIQYDKRCPTLTNPLTKDDRGEVEVEAADCDTAAAAFMQRFPASHQIKAIFPRLAFPERKD